jgi:hypothetical protein
MANYLHRLAALEERLGGKPCGPALCLKCTVARLPVMLRPGEVQSIPEWAGCDGRPTWSSLTELLHEMRIGAAVTGDQVAVYSNASWPASSPSGAAKVQPAADANSTKKPRR